MAKTSSISGGRKPQSSQSPKPGSKPKPTPTGNTGTRDYKPMATPTGNRGTFEVDRNTTKK